ncbi:imidazoleglycerol-phosphate dehydratase [Rhodothalassium salexigens DSM 2132]|uniref:Imidazoleglycerol-phosphate dehydratase n=2 Tax=Rhodothalassium salexigens TaxID=1086 RepID=A0A4R2PQ21_RHOSA|nr:imidazoleglycerol-phosphate dehydratase HisB [Rhodothalassium salexigens]MBB4211169.1 imidazoleglycerol-phosphate dehydratase [Rhodothalassium salexigens DSM 2132]TCP36175.1 imidazoleglycerol-phosphate dehydratase [Rhodothalassium salexigens DSM 2132]
MIMRQGQVSRQTKETAITARVALDGTGIADIDTGVGFFDHMLTALARHSLIDVALKAEGDLHIDAHHTVEDCGIVLGRAVAQALGDKAGIERFGAAYVAMDEALVRAALDVSGRAFLVWDVTFTQDRLGTMDAELVQEFFRAFAWEAGLTLHVTQLAGTNNHHIAEAAFKALARALKMALAIDPRRPDAAPSTKGTLSA